MAVTLVIQALALGDGGYNHFWRKPLQHGSNRRHVILHSKSLPITRIHNKTVGTRHVCGFIHSNVCTALAVGIEIGLFPMVGTLGGIFVTVPSMLMWYVPTGIIEGVVASSLIVSLSRLRGVKLLGLEMCRKQKPVKGTSQSLATNTN